MQKVRGVVLLILSIALIAIVVVVILLVAHFSGGLNVGF